MNNGLTRAQQIYRVLTEKQSFVNSFSKLQPMQDIIKRFRETTAPCLAPRALGWWWMTLNLRLPRGRPVVLFVINDVFVERIRDFGDIYEKGFFCAVFSTHSQSNPGRPCKPMSDRIVSKELRSVPSFWPLQSCWADLSRMSLNTNSPLSALSARILRILTHACA